MKNYNVKEEIAKIKKLQKYTFLKEEFIPEINSHMLHLEHNKTKAKILLLPNTDDNKVFTIGFRTPSEDSTGVAHIIEHSVLSGSRKFPAKDPFIELAKGSLNTFLNAMTYPDKTIYPVASRNHKDFQNLIDVYLDCVFYPNIYKEKKIFMQEGWHYALENPKEELKYTGVVYNEMKGVYSSADGLLARMIMKSIYEDHSYGEESGGDPEYITDLTYEDFLGFHKKYYHPSNSYIYFYGDMDMAEKLEWMDKEYLSEFEYLEVDSEIKDVLHWSNPKEFIYDYSISESENEENATYLSLNTLVDEEFDPIKNKAFQILSYVLFGKPGAVIKEALLEAGIGEDVSGGYDYGIKFPSFAITVKNSNIDKKAEFMAIIKGSLRKIVSSGIDKEELLAAINVTEFQDRESDFGGYPNGLIYIMEIFNTWLYDKDPSANLRYENVYTELRKKISEGYFENLIKEVLLDNPHEALVILQPLKGLTTKREADLRKKLLKIKESLTPEQLQEIIKDTKELEEFQEAPTKREDLEKIPLLSREDLDRESEKAIWEENHLIFEDIKVPMIHSEIFTSGIAYMKLLFDASSLSMEELPYLAFLQRLLKQVDTQKYSYSKLATIINLNLGGIGFSFDTFVENESKTKFIFSVMAKSLMDKIPCAYDLMYEILFLSKLEDKKRIKELLAQEKANVKNVLVSAGHITALQRAASFVTKESYFDDATKGIRYYRFLEHLTENFEESIDETLEKIKNICRKILTVDNMLVHSTCTNQEYPYIEEETAKLCERIPKTQKREGEVIYQGEPCSNEAFTTSSMVNYVARYGNFKKHGFSYTGTLKILNNILNYHYLWENVRVKGNAYGCIALIGRNGGVGFSSYRDPNLANTYKVYENIAEYVKNFEADEREMTKFIIGTISALDKPLTPALKGAKGLGAYLSKIDPEQIQKERIEILTAKAEDIRALYPLIQAILLDNYQAVVGNAVKIQEDCDKNMHIEALFQE